MPIHASLGFGRFDPIKLVFLYMIHHICWACHQLLSVGLYILCSMVSVSIPKCQTASAAWGNHSAPSCSECRDKTVFWSSQHWHLTPWTSNGTSADSNGSHGVLPVSVVIPEKLPGKSVTKKNMNFIYLLKLNCCELACWLIICN